MLVIAWKKTTGDKICMLNPLLLPCKSMADFPVSKFPSCNIKKTVSDKTRHNSKDLLTNVPLGTGQISAPLSYGLYCIPS
jgi:hypothetical protein